MARIQSGAGMASVSGSIKIGEAQAAMGSLVKRQRGPTWLYAVILYAFMIIAAVIGCLIGLLTGWNINLMGCGAAIVALLTWFLVGRRYVVWQFRNKMTARGVPMHVPVRLDIAPEAMTYDTHDVHVRAQWSGISELYSKAGYWIFMIHSSGYFLPKHFFADAGAERAFIAEALGYMSEAARARSKYAVTFAAAGKS